MIHELLNKYSNQTVILIDLSWVLYRSHYAYGNLTNQSGEPTGSYYGLGRTIQTLKTSYPDALILLVDDGHPYERKQLNESYKGNREHSVHFRDKKFTVDCMIQMVPDVYRIYNSIVEADDMMFSISRIKQFNNQFIIYTSDKDLYQALDDTTLLASEINKGYLVTKDVTHEQYTKNFMDLHPRQLPYFRAVLGDPSDNLKIIIPRFPSKVAYYFAKNCIKYDGYELHITKPTTKPDDLTDKQYEWLLKIYSSKEFMDNLKIMQLSYIDDIPVMPKNKQTTDVSDTLSNLELHQYWRWIQELYS